MDYEKTTSSFDSFELQFTPVAQGFLREIAKWAKFLSITGFVFIGIYVLLALVMFAGGAAMDAATSEMDGMEVMGKVGGAVLGMIYLVGALLYFFPVLYLYKFASKAKTALDSNSSEYLTDSLENLKSHYKFMGVLMIILLVFVGLGFILTIFGIGAAAAMA